MSDCNKLKFSEVHTGKGKFCREILETLPDWFGIEEARENYISAVRKMSMVACLSDQLPIGFLSLKIHNSWNAEIFVMGISPEWQRRGIGTRLIEMAIDIADKSNVRLLTVKTISSISADKHYAKTRKFYETCGFESFEEFPHLWGEENPCLLMVKPVR